MVDGLMTVVADAGVGLYLLAVAALVYILPSIVAEHRKAPNLKSIAVLNILLGWTLIGWVAALAMAMRDVPSAKPTPSSFPGRSDQTVADIRHLADLHSRGALSDEEFAAAKRRLLG